MRLLFFMRKPENRGDPRRDGLARAREDAMEQMRQRLDEPEPIATPGEADASPISAEATDPLAGLAPESAPDPLAGLAEAAPVVDGGGPAEGAEDKPKDPLLDDSLDMDLLDIFRDAKNESEEGNLASEVDEVSITDLLGDINGIRVGLGIKARPAPLPEPETPVEPVPEQEVAEPEVEAIAQAESAIVAEQPPTEEMAVATPDEGEESPAGTEDEALPIEDFGDERVEDEPAAIQAAPVLDEAAVEESAMDAVPLQLDAAEDDSDALRPGPRPVPGGRYLLHVLFFGLALAAAGGAGLRSASESGAFAAGPPQRDAAILAYLKPPVILPEPEPLPAPALTLLAATPTPTPAPTPTATPAPDPRQYGFSPGQAAWVVYTVQSGDSLASIGKTFAICPDHILWSNPGRAIGESLTVGDDLILPGYPGLVYKVREGDTIAKIAARYSTDPGMIVAYPGNKLRGDGDLEPGKSILLPEAIPPEAFEQSAEARWAYTNPSDYGYIWPFYGPITSHFGEQRPGYTHNAIDIGGLYQFGTPVLAVAAGIVVTAVGDADRTSNEGYGNHVIIEHEDGSRSLYAHMYKTWVSEGDEVKQGQPLGGLGCTGHSTGTHLHFELYRDGGAVDPLAYLPKR
jgi:murein DD-endopeptidase MepM/ murein hydrolase activator NlpD